MKINYKMALTLLAGIAFGGLAVQALHAQAKPKIYIVNDVEVTDPVGFKAHAGHMDPLIEKFDGTFLARGGKARALNGAGPHRMVIVVFENIEKEQAWENDPEVKELIATRGTYANFRSIVIEGVAN
jgi:uncharacterized protein (DUF1330 family)